MLNNMELHSIFINISRKIFVDSLINITLIHFTNKFANE